MDVLWDNTRGKQNKVLIIKWEGLNLLSWSVQRKKLRNVRDRVGRRGKEKGGGREFEGEEGRKKEGRRRVEGRREGGRKDQFSKGGRMDRGGGRSNYIIYILVHLFAYLQISQKCGERAVFC